MICLSWDKMPDDFHRIQKDVELNENQSFSGAVSMKSSSGSVIAMVVLLVFFIIGSGYLLIYNVLYISISKDTRFYGLMKTLGTTQVQIKSLVKNQALKFACIGIPIGIVLATAVSFGIVPFVLNEGFEQGKSIMDAEMFFHPSIYILSVIFSAITVWIACNAPAKAAAKISPVEALKFQNFAPKKTKSRNSTNGGKLHIMAFHNVFRDKKRAILVFMSLFMGITMILGVNGVIGSMNAENFIKEYMDYHFEYNDIQFEQPEQPNKEVPQFDEHFVEQIQQVNGIENVDVQKTVWAGIDFDEVADDEAAKKLADEHHIEYEERHKKGDIINLFFEEYCEKELIQPTFIMDHPIEISPLTKKKPSDPNKVERFELFINTWEMCNAYSELNDPIDQRERFKAQDALADAGDEEANHTDEDFLNALEIGMPPTGGIGYGIDRLVMLLTDSQAIRDVLLFPTMKSQGAAKNEANNAAQAGVTASAQPVSAQEETAPSDDNNGFFTPNDKIDFSKVTIEPLFEEQVDFDTFSKSDFRAVKVKACEAVKKSKKLLQFTLDDGTGTDRTILSGIHAFYEPEELVGKTLIAITNLPPRAMMGIESCGMLLSAIHEEEGEEKLHLLMVDNHIPAGAKLY